ncbi:MAG: hypothetical protein DCC73_09685 [Proteobacteria bacterium]|nr:MAG: hypothetical protein DCC73_09685 [Pseudomonadota bacterium]
MSATSLAVVREYLRRIGLAYEGVTIDPFELLHPEMRYTLTGTTPDACRSISVADYKELCRRAGRMIKTGAVFKIIIRSVIEDGDRVLLESRVRGEGANGRPYNNQYIMIFRVHDGLITEFVEICDNDYLMCSLWGADVSYPVL